MTSLITFRDVKSGQVARFSQVMCNFTQIQKYIHQFKRHFKCNTMVQVAFT